MWLPRAMQAEIEAVARVFYVDRETARRWNEHRRAGELRMMCGWCWEARAGRWHRLGLKTMTACYIDAWYALIAKAEPPRVSQPRLIVRKVA